MTGTHRGKVVFIAHAYRGDPEANLRDVERYIRYAVEQGQHPCCSWYAMVHAFDDSDDTIRARGIATNFEIMSRCDELWVCGARITQGVEAEIDRAFSLRLPITYIDLDAPIPVTRLSVG